MNDKAFFKPTSLYKEYMILDLIEKNSHITQREMARIVEISLAMINLFLDDYESSGLIKRHKHTSKTLEYIITKKGIERRKILNIGFLKSSQFIYNTAKANIEVFINQVIKKGFNEIVLYGAGEVAEIFLLELNSGKNYPICVIAVIDDDSKKIGKTLLNKEIISIEDIKKYSTDGVLISSYTNRDIMFNKLKKIGYEDREIIQFFD